MELRNALTARFALDVPATLASDYPTQAAILCFVMGQLGAQYAADEGPAPPIAALQLQVPGSRQWIELIAVGCKYPGAAEGDSHCHPFTADYQCKTGPMPNLRICLHGTGVHCIVYGHP